MNCNILTTGRLIHWLSDLNKVPDLLDFAVTKGFHQTMDIAKCLDTSGSHSLIIITIGVNVIMKVKTATWYNKKTYWNLFKQWLEANINIKTPLKIVDDLDDSTDYIANNQRGNELQN